MALLPAKLVVAFDASSVAGALVARGLRGPRLEAFTRLPLDAGALVPSPFEANLSRPADVGEALKGVVRALGVTGRRACLVLPDGVARTLLLDVPGGTDPAEFAHFRMTQVLPYPASEAVVDVLRTGHGRYVAAAVRRSVAAAYEAAAAEAGLVQERVDLAPLAALCGLLRGVGRGSAVDLILGDAALTLVAFEEGVLRAYRNRRRDPDAGEAERLGEEVDRTAALAGNGARPPRLRVVGSGATALIRALSFGGRPAEAAWGLPGNGLPVAAAELAWLGAALG